MNILQSVINQMGLRQPSQITTCFIHHSVANKTLDIEEIAAEEMHSMGFLSIGYNAYTKCIDVDKDLWVVQQGRPLNRIPAAQYGMNNEGYAICIGGNYAPGGAPFLDIPSSTALKAVADQIMLVKAKCPNLKFLAGHCDVATIKAKNRENPADFSTLCPGSRMYAKLDDLRKATGLAKYPGVA